MRELVAIVVFAVALPLAAQELPSAPSATKQQAEEQAFQAQMDAPPTLSQRLTAGDKSQVFMQDSVSPFTFSAAAASAGLTQAGGGARALQGSNAATASAKTGFVRKVVSSVLGRPVPGAQGSEKRTFGARVAGALSQLADIDDEPDTTQPGYSQYLGMAVSNMVASAYTPLDGHGIRHARGGFGAHLGAGGFLPSVKRLFLGQKVLERQRDALTWRTGSMAQSPGSVH